LYVPVTPVVSVKLADVLDRKHLPPLGDFPHESARYHFNVSARVLGLKDFEEWLLFVEQSPENL
jgi:hypothetical protein